MAFTVRLRENLILKVSLVLKRDIYVLPLNASRSNTDTQPFCSV